MNRPRPRMTSFFDLGKSASVTPHHFWNSAYSFSIRYAAGNSAPDGVAAALGDMAEPAGDDHFWLSAEAVIGLSSHKDDTQWVSAFWDMLGKVEKYGYSDMAGRRVKAHVEPQA